MLDWDALIQERNAWVEYNFPKDNDANGTSTGNNSILGLIEEVGELAHHHLKADQKIRGDAAFHEAEAKDAIGDMMVYLMGPMARNGATPRPVDMVNAVKWAVPGDQLIGGMALWAAYISGRHHGDESVPHYSWETLITKVTVLAQSYCITRGWDFDQIVLSTWAQVKERDWIRWPDKGRPPYPHLTCYHEGCDKYVVKVEGDSIGDGDNLTCEDGHVVYSGK